jgi:membrane protein required for colicin V production
MAAFYFLFTGFCAGRVPGKPGRPAHTDKPAETVMLGWMNKLAGIVFYLLIYSMIYSIFLFYAVQMKLLPATTTSASVIYPYISPFAPDIIGFLGNLIPLFKDIFGQLEAVF